MRATCNRKISFQADHADSSSSQLGADSGQASGNERGDLEAAVQRKLCQESGMQNQSLILPVVMKWLHPQNRM